jgi:hypothetical protein
MKKFFLLPFLIICFSFTQDNPYRKIRNRCFTGGEHLEYRVHYGFINAGEAIIKVNPKHYKVNDRICYKIEVVGRSIGTFDLILRIRDTWGTYMDTTSLIPHQAYRFIEEGKYRKHEITNFNHLQDSAEVKVLDRKTKKYKPSLNYKVPDNIQDMVSGYFFLRTIDYSKLNKGDIIGIPAFFEDSIYNFRIRYVGREMLDTKFGEMKAIKLVPIMPANQLFDGEDAITVWLSDDPNKIPLKIRAEMFVGAVEIDIKKFEGLRN